METDTRSALRRAIELASGASALARALGVTPQAVAQWREAPAKRVLDIERLTGISRYDLRPDLYGPHTPARVSSTPPQPSDAAPPVSEGAAREQVLA